MRTLNRLLAPIAALALIALAVFVAIEVTAAGLGKQPVVIHWHGWYRAGLHNVWRSTGPLVISSIIVAIGLLLLALQLTPRRVTDRELSETSPDIDVVLRSSGLATTLRGAAESVEGVASAKVKVKRRAASVRATTHGSTREQAERIRGEVEAATRGRLEGADLRRPPRLSVDVRPGKKAQ